MRGDNKPRRRRLSEVEHALWRGVTRSVAPLKRRMHALVTGPLDGGMADRKPRPVVPTRSNPPPTRASSVPPPVPAVTPQVVSRPNAAVFDRRQKRRLARGVEPIGARIDLHGRTQVEAHAALLAFLAGAQSKRATTVLVITGKGAREGLGERGVLRKQVPQWLALPAFRAFVAGVEEAHFAHGGPGALYVRVRRA